MQQWWRARPCPRRAPASMSKARSRSWSRSPRSSLLLFLLRMRFALVPTSPFLRVLDWPGAANGHIHCSLEFLLVTMRCLTTQTVTMSTLRSKPPARVGSHKLLRKADGSSLAGTMHDVQLTGKQLNQQKNLRQIGASR